MFYYQVMKIQLVNVGTSPLQNSSFGKAVKNQNLFHNEF